MKRVSPYGILSLWAVCLTTWALPAAAAPVVSVQQGSTPIGQGSTFTFPSTPVGIGSPVIFTISNTGNQTLTISNPSSLVTGSGAFGETVSAPSSIAAGGSGNFRIRLLGGSPGTATATVSIQSNDPVHGTFSFTVQGTITGPVLSVAGVAKGSTFTFPNSTPAGTATSVLFTINNTGTTPLNLGNPSTLVSGAAFFEIVSPATPVAAGGSTVFRVRLYSTTAGTFTGTVSITSDDPNNSPYTFNLQGTVTPPPAPILSVAGVPKGSTFVFPASTPVGVATSVVFTINNTGSAPLNLSNAASLVSGGTFFEIANPTTPVAAGSSTTFRVRLYGTTPGTFTGTVSIQSDDPNNNPYTFTVQGTITGPILSVTAGTSAVPKGSTFVFPASTPVGVSTSVLFTINNTGSTPLNLGNAAGLVSGGDFFEIASPTTPVAAGGSTTCRVRLYGTTPGTFTGTVSIQSDDANGSPYTFTVQGTITGPILSVTAGASAVPKGSTFVFPATTPVGVSTSVVFTINNTGSAPLNLSNAASLVSGSTFFEIANPTTPVAAGGSTTCRVRLYGTTPGTFTGTVSIQSDDANGSPYTFTVQGTITGPILSVTAGSSAVPKGSTFVYPASTPAGVATSVLFTINNTGSAPLNLSNAASLVSCTDFFEILNPTTPVAAGGSTIFRIRLYGTTPGTFTCTVTILSDDPNDSPYTFTIQGTITPAAVIGVQLGSTVVANGSTVTFPSTPVGVGSPLTFTITDTGSTTLSISNPTTLVSGNAAFGETVNAPASVNAGGNGSFRVRLLGGSPGNATGTVTIQSNDPVTPTFSFTIQGTVNPAPRITVQQGATAIANGSTFTFPASTPAGTPETVVFSLVNAGTAALNLGNAAALVSGTSCSETQVPVTPVAANGGSTGFAVQVLAATGNTYTCTVTIASDDPIYPSFSFTVVATVNPAPHLRVVQAWNNTTVVPGGTVTFPDVAVGTAESLQLLLVNDGPGTLTLANPTALVGGACYAELDPAPAATINAGQSAGVRVRLECGTAGLQTGTFSASSNDPLTPVYSFNLSGAVGLTLPPLRVESGDGVFVAHEGSYAFPDTGIGQKVSRGFTIFNDGAQDFVIANPAAMVSGDAGFSQSAQPASATVPAGGSQTFRVQLLSSQVGAHYGEVTIASADPTQNPFLFGVSGTVQAPDFALGVSPASRGLVAGQSVSYTLTLSSLFGFSANVSLSLSGLDGNSSSTFTPASVVVGSTSATLRIYTTAATPAGTQHLTIIATGGGVTHTVPISLTVTSLDFSLAVDPQSQAVQAGLSAAYTVSVTAQGWSPAIALSVSSGLPPGATASFSPASASPGAASTLTVSTAAATPAGSYTLTIAGTSGSLGHDATATLQVTSPTVGNGGPPVIQGVSPNIFTNGQTVTVALTGQNFQGASVMIPTKQADPSHPVSRIFPTAQVQSIAADGTSMQVLVDASDTRILDYYNLVVQNAAGQQATQIRVLPQGPIVDLWTPRRAAPGYTFVLSIVGHHLAGATVTTDAGSAITIFGLDNAADDHLTAILQVAANAVVGAFDLIVQGTAGGQLMLPVDIVPPSNLFSPSAGAQTRMLAAGAARGKPGPSVAFAPFELRRSEATQVTKEGVRVERSASGPRLVAKDQIGFLTVTIPLASYHYQKALVFDPVTLQVGDALLQALEPGNTVRFGGFVLSFYFEADLNVYFVYDTDTGFSFPLFCAQFLAASEIPGNNGFFLDFDFCGGSVSGSFTSGSTDTLTMQGGSCAQVAQEGPPVEGLAYGDLTVSDCCAQPIDISGSGTSFTGSAFGISFSVDTPDAGTTSPDDLCNQCNGNDQGTLQALSPIAGLVQKDVGGGCMRSPFGPGRLRFQGMPQPQLCNLQVIPEMGIQLATPVDDVWYDADGFYQRGEPCFPDHKCGPPEQTPRTIWFKVPNNCDATINADGSLTACCNACAAMFQAARGKVGTPQWTTDDPAFCHATFPYNPFCSPALPQPCQ